MDNRTIAIVGQGDMGSAVSAACVRRGYRVVTDLSGRSPHTCALAEAAGSEDVGSLEALVGQADVVLSILPPARAADFAARVAAAMRATGRRPLYADCNAVSPATVAALGARFDAIGAAFVDVGIVGPAPRVECRLPTRFYIAGPARAALLALDVAELRLVDLGETIGRASAIKMAYASLNKGTDALHTAVLLAAESLGVRDELMTELEWSQAETAQRMRRRVPYLAATAARYVGEMREIAATYRDAGVTPKFHEGAEWVYARLAATPLAAETRATLPAQRTLDEALELYCAVPKAVG
jgi:3-hydroxyisobutyrate dehydrogenase-like beta-hydroxyacid dehydrogenase